MSIPNPLYKKDEVVLCFIDATILPIVINDCIFKDGSFYYKMEYDKYLEVLENAKELGLEDKIPTITKNQIIVEEDLFKTMKDIETTASVIRNVLNFIKHTERKTGR